MENEQCDSVISYVSIFYLIWSKEDELFQELNDHVPPSHFQLLVTT